MDPALEWCENCGAALDANVKCPVTTRQDENGRLLLFAFCDETCKRAWTSTAGGGEAERGRAAVKRS